jgi:hypothetical protein
MKKETKTQVLTVSKRFMAWHPKAGEPTNFREKILNQMAIIEQAENCQECRDWGGGDCRTCYVPAGFNVETKPHTIRDNRSYWESVIEREMLLSVRQWSGKPYHTSQETFLDLEPGKWGIQFITMIKVENGLEAFVCEKSIDIDVLAANDGLSRADFEAWFAPYFKRRNVFYGVIIHFTDFRY